MYSPFAIAALKAPAERERLAALEESSPVLARLMLDNLDAADQRLTAERDPAQREALRAADARDQAEAEASAQSLSDMLRPMRVMKTMVGKVTRVIDRLSAAVRWVDQAKADRKAQLIAYLHVVVSTPVLIVEQIAAATTYFRSAERQTTEVPPPLDQHVHALIAAPRPGPVAGTALAA